MLKDTIAPVEEDLSTGGEEAAGDELELGDGAAEEVSPEGGEEAAPEEKPAEGDAEVEAGPNAEAEPGDDATADGENLPADVQDINAEQAAEEVTPEVMEAAKAVYAQTEAESIKAIEAQVQNRILLEVQVPAQRLEAEQVTLNAQLKAMQDSLKDPDYEGGEKPLNATQAIQVNRILNRLNSIELEAKQLYSHHQTITQQAEGVKFGARMEASIKANQHAHPILKQYDAEYRYALSKGYQFENSAQAVGVCKALREANGGKAAPSVSKAELTRQALQADITRKNKAKIGAGSGGSGASNIRSKPAEPAEITKLWSQIESYPEKKRKTA